MQLQVILKYTCTLCFAGCGLASLDLSTLRALLSNYRRRWSVWQRIFANEFFHEKVLSRVRLSRPREVDE